MFYDLPVPCIVDTKNIKKVFANPKYVTKENLEKLNDVVYKRKQQKLAVKALGKLKPQENAHPHTIQQILDYFEASLKLESIFDKDYPIKKNFKWKPLLTIGKQIKFSGDIKFGKSGEIIMALYCAFAAQFKEINSHLTFIKNNFASLDQEKAQAPAITQFNTTLQTSLKMYVKIWDFLNTNSQKITSSFQNMALYKATYVETQGISTEILLTYTKINANILYVEVLRRQENYQEIISYGKSIVVQARSVEAYIGPYIQETKQDFIHYLDVVQRLYKAIVLWSLIHIYLKKNIKQQYEAGENYNMLAGACSSFASEINKLQIEINRRMNVNKSIYSATVNYYFERIITPKTYEIGKVYGEVYKNSPYDDNHFTKIQEKDYIENIQKEIQDNQKNQ